MELARRLLMWFAPALVALAPCGISSAAVAQGPGETPLKLGVPVVLKASNGARQAIVSITAGPIQKRGLFWKLLEHDDWYSPETQIESISIKLGKRSLGVPPGAVLDIFDPHAVALRPDGSGFVLDIFAADGAVSYNVHIRIGKTRIVERTVIDGESQELTERDIYPYVPPLKDVPAAKTP